MKTLKKKNMLRNKSSIVSSSEAPFPGARTASAGRRQHSDYTTECDYLQLLPIW